MPISLKRMVVIADSSKEVDVLGKFPLPVEVNPFGIDLTRQCIQDSLEILGMKDIDVILRHQDGGAPLLTDGGHHIFDLHCGTIGDVDGLASLLDQVPGVVEHGLFIGLADLIIIGETDTIRTLQR